MGTNRITVGLFDTTLPEKPAYVSRYRPAASVEAGDYEDVVFYDVPEGFDFVPLAWYDEDNDKRLDAGEFVTAFNFAVGTAKFTMDDDGYDYTNDGATGTLSQTPVAMNDRKFDLEIALAAADIAASLANDAAAVSSTIVSTVFDDGSGGAGSTETAGTLTADLIINNGVTDITIPITFGADAGGGDATIAHGEDMYVVLEDSSAFDVAGASYDADNEVLTIAAIPASITTIGADSEYSVDLTIDEIANSTGAFTTYNGAPVTVTWTQGDLAITDGVVAPAVGAIDITPIVAD